MYVFDVYHPISNRGCIVIWPVILDILFTYVKYVPAHHLYAYDFLYVIRALATLRMTYKFLISVMFLIYIRSGRAPEWPPRGIV